MSRDFLANDRSVVVVAYRHKHGEDLRVFGDHEAAETWVRQTMAFYADELDDDDRERLNRALEAEDGYHDAWYQMTNEIFDVEDLEVLVLAPTAAEELKEVIET